MIKGLMITGGVLLLGILYFFIWACCKAASNADEELGYDYITEEDKEAM